MLKLAAMILLAGLLLSTILVFLSRDGELHEKPAWAALQAVEYNDRGNQSVSPILKKAGSRYIALGVPGIGEPDIGVTNPAASKRMWLLLNEHSRDRRVKTLNTYRNYALDCGYVQKIRAQIRDLDDYVLKHLLTICRTS